MASIQYVQSKGRKKTWRYQIKQGQKNLLSQSGFKTKKEAIQHASTYLESFNRGNIRKDMSMVELVHHYLVVKIYGKKVRVPMKNISVWKVKLQKNLESYQLID